MRQNTCVKDEENVKGEGEGEWQQGPCSLLWFVGAKAHRRSCCCCSLECWLLLAGKRGKKQKGCWGGVSPEFGGCWCNWVFLGSFVMRILLVFLGL